MLTGREEEGQGRTAIIIITMAECADLLLPITIPAVWVVGWHLTNTMTGPGEAVFPKKAKANQDHIMATIIVVVTQATLVLHGILEIVNHLLKILGTHLTTEIQIVGSVVVLGLVDSLGAAGVMWVVVALQVAEVGAVAIEILTKSISISSLFTFWKGSKLSHA